MIIANTPLRCVTLAYQDTGLVPEDELPNAEQIANGLGRLNDLITLFQTQGLKLWLNSLFQLPLQIGKASYTLGTNAIRVIEGYYIAPGGSWVPLDALSWKTYNTTGNKTQLGAVTGYFVDKQQDNPVVSLWLVPDSSAVQGQVQLLVQRPVSQIANLNDTINFPKEWFIALRWALADEICIGQPEPIVQRCEKRAQVFRQALEDWDYEDASTRFEPDGSRGYGSSRFRY